MTLLLYAAPVFLLFEGWQLFVCERYTGVKVLRAGGDPREKGLSERTAFFWIATIVAYWLWMGLLFGGGVARPQVATIFAVNIIGHLVRRNTPLKWTLVTLTFEGAVRIGMLISMMMVLYRARW
ncbi:MAG TPA: hypothetical protein VMM36_01100 [Opitutaceae bacterium]|nr:hypothetical protein [Opitutaceae bacterium]